MRNQGITLITVSVCVYSMGLIHISNTYQTTCEILKANLTNPNSIKMLDARVLLGTVVGSHMYAVVKLPETFLPRIVSVALVYGH